MFKKDIGIDLGTANTLVYMKGKGIIMREPSVVAVDTKTDTVRYVGHEAKEVIGRTPGSIVAVRPLKEGVIADFDIASSMLQIFIKKACGTSLFNRPRVVICIPSGVTEVERRAVREASLKAIRVPNLPLVWTMFFQLSCLARFMPLQVKSLPPAWVKAR